MYELTLVLTATLFGGMVLFSFAFAPFLFSEPEPERARPLIHAAFPHFDLFVLGTSGVAGLLALSFSGMSDVVLLLIAGTTAYARQVLMPQINAASDAGNKKRYGRLHGVSVVNGLAQIARELG
jgi:hypothetical protein